MGLLEKSLNELMKLTLILITKIISAPVRNHRNRFRLLLSQALVNFVKLSKVATCSGHWGCAEKSRATRGGLGLLCLWKRLMDRLELKFLSFANCFCRTFHNACSIKWGFCISSCWPISPHILSTESLVNLLLHWYVSKTPRMSSNSSSSRTSLSINFLWSFDLR